MKELIGFVAGRLVDNLDAIEVVEKEQDDVITIELRVAKEDLGKVIGKQGRTARAMRMVLSAAAARRGKRSRLEIVE